MDNFLIEGTTDLTDDIKRRFDKVKGMFKNMASESDMDYEDMINIYAFLAMLELVEMMCIKNDIIQTKIAEKLEKL